MQTKNRNLIGLAIIAVIGLSTWSIGDLIQRAQAAEDTLSSVTRPERTDVRADGRDEDFEDRIQGTVISVDAATITLNLDITSDEDDRKQAPTSDATPVRSDVTTGSTQAGKVEASGQSGGVSERTLQATFSLSPELTIVDGNGTTLQNVNPGDQVELRFDGREVIRIIVLDTTTHS